MDADRLARACLVHAPYGRVVLGNSDVHTA
jgi:hypothetical protein